MATTRTTRLGLHVPAYTDRRWDIPLLISMGMLDETEAIGALAARAANVDSSLVPTDRVLAIAPGRYVKADGSVNVYAGSTVTVPDNTTTYVYLQPDGSLGTSGSGFPGLASAHIPLAVVVTDSGIIDTITDARPAYKMIGPAQPVAREAGGSPAMGVATLVAGTVTVLTGLVTANSRIFLTHQSASGTVGVPYVSARSAGVSFTITSTSSSDTSVIAWMLVEPTA